MKKLLTAVIMILVPFVSQGKEIAERADDVRPLLNGQTAPDIRVTTSEGKQVALHSLLADKKTIMFFYRGGWCPFCNTQMGQLKAIEPKLNELGYQLIGVSTDSVKMLHKSIKSKALQYELLSDFNSELSQAFGLAFFASDKVTKRYVSGMDLQNPLQKNKSGEDRLVLPVPAIYLFDKQGLVKFSYVNPNFKVRLAPELLLAAARVN
jgi:peroxiredoxin